MTFETRELGERGVDEADGWSIEVDRDACIGSGLCSVYAPETFSQDDEAKVFVLDARGDGVEAIRTAVGACPTRALRLTTIDDGTS
jgi:ferredoxin